jgi:HTH-type transcriptional repressor of NAD biosynthesis genes
MEQKNTVGFIGGKFLPLHLGHVYAIEQAAKQVDELYVILTSSEKRDKELCERDGIKYIPTDIRLSWLGAALKDISNAQVIHVKDNWGNDDYDWDKGAEMIQKAIGKPIDSIFSSENDYEKHFIKNYPNAKHIVIDNDRKNIPISATDIRKDLSGNWDKLPSYVKSYFTKRVAIVGTESCGKTILTIKLAEYFRTNYVHEVGRDYCEKYDNQLTVEMFDQIGIEHFLLQQKKAEESNKVMFVDSDAVITQYYLDMYFNGRKSPLIEEIIKLQEYDLVIYLEPDVKWVEDGLRFAGDEGVRKSNNEKLKKMYKDRGIKFVSISGSYSERFEKAKNFVRAIL